jgi:putative ABC transport system permease protein
MWLLAIKAMLADRGRLIISLLAVTFSVVLVNLQGGLLLGLLGKASLLVDFGGADIWVGHRYMQDAETGSTPIPARWLARIRGTPGVQRADLYVLTHNTVVLPGGRAENVVVVGCDPASLLGQPQVMAEGDPRALLLPDSVLVDADDREKFGNCGVGDLREINGRRARVVGLTRGMVSFTTRPYVFTTLDRARNHYGANFPRDRCSYILVKARSGTDIESLLHDLRGRAPELDVCDRRTYGAMSMHYWLTRTGVGISFGLSTVLGLLIGLAVVAQTLYAAVTERVKEYATLKALGAENRLVARFLVVQALGNAVLGSVLGLVIAVAIAVSPVNTSRAPIELRWWIGGVSVVLITLVCLGAAWLPYWRIRRIDPASVLRS